MPDKDLRLEGKFRRRADWMTTAGTPECEARVAMAMFARYGIPRSMLDLGCGSGGWICRIAASLGVESYGVDIAVENEKRRNLELEQADLSVWPRLPGQKFELVISFETGEHLPESAADHLVRLLTSHAEGLILFTAAVPGQGGDGHINCQPHEYWQEKFEALSFLKNERETETLRALFKASEGLCSWYSSNLQVFAPQDFSGWVPWSEE